MSQILEERVVRIADALEITGHRRSTFLAKVRGGEIAKPLRLGPRAVGWRMSDLHRYIDSLPRAA
jgi:prophage regulatory protein